jgi:hypothetical protein
MRVQVRRTPVVPKDSYFLIEHSTHKARTVRPLASRRYCVEYLLNSIKCRGAVEIVALMFVALGSGGSWIWVKAPTWLCQNPRSLGSKPPPYWRGVSCDRRAYLARCVAFHCSNDLIRSP